MSSARVILLLAVAAVAAPPALAQTDLRIDPSAEMFRRIRDDAPFPWAVLGEKPVERADDDRMEELAYDEVLRHARQFSPDELERAARRDVTYRDLMVPARLSYKLELVYFEGRLKLLRRAKNALTAAKPGDGGLSDVYEAWVFPRDEWNPICVIVSELPPGLTPPTGDRETVDKWVAAAGYSFKLLQYESERKNLKNPDQNRFMRAPALIGRTLRELPPPPENDLGQSWRATFLPLVVGAVTGLALILVGLNWWFRRGDRVARRTMDQSRDKNPFSEGTS